MKKILQVSGLIVALISLTATATFAQTENVKVGGGLVLGTGVLNGSSDLDNDLGIRADGVYTFNEKFRGVADFMFYFPHKQGGVKFTMWEANLNGHYVFTRQEDINFYGLAGLNLAFLITNFDTNGFGTSSNSDSEAGLNLGGGLEYNLDFSDFFAEIKYVISDADQLAVSAGLRFDI